MKAVFRKALSHLGEVHVTLVLGNKLWNPFRSSIDNMEALSRLPCQACRPLLIEERCLPVWTLDELKIVLVNVPGEIGNSTLLQPSSYVIHVR